MFITTKNKKVTEIVEKSDTVKKRKAAIQKSEIERNWNYIKKSEQIKSRDFEYKEYSTHQKLVNEFKNKISFESRCFIIGGGPSLKRFDFSRLSNEFTIAINRAHEFIKDPSIIFFIDEDGFYNKLMEKEFGGAVRMKFQKSRSLKIALNISGRNYGNNIYSVPLSEKPEMTFDLKEGLYDGGNSGYAALNLAVCMGVKTIYLLGYDMKGDGKGNQAWFHSGYEQKGKESNYKDWIKDFERIAPVLKNKGIKVVNLNPNSELKCFEFGNIDNIKDMGAKDLYFLGPNGFGDNFYLRCLVRHLVKKYETVYIRTALPEAYWDIPNVKFVYNDRLDLRTQLNHCKKYHKDTWSKVPLGTKELQWSACLPLYRQRSFQKHLTEDRSVTKFIQEENNIKDFDFSFPLKDEWIISAKKVIESLDNKGKKICIIRPPTVRKEWPAISRNPKIEHIQLLIDKYKKEYYFISIADIEQYEEWLDGDLDGIDKRFHHGEIPITTIFGLIKLTDMMITYPGFFTLIAIVLRSKCFCIFGGLQTHDHLFNENMGLENFEYVIPEPFCNCFDMAHKCNKEIPEEKIIKKFDDLKNRKKKLRKASVGMPAGIADMHWIMTKMESFKEKNCIDKLEVVIYPDYGHTDSPAFLKLIPFVDSVRFREDPYKFTFSIVGMSGNPIYKDRQGVDYLMEFNSRLEEGVRLENILPEYKTNLYYPMEYPLESKEFADRIKKEVGGKLYLIYTSSIATDNNWARGTWRPEDWIKLTNKIFKATGCNPVLIGKDWDTDYAENLMKLDSKKGIYNLVAKTDMKQVLALIREANVIVGFLSGLTIMAAYFKTPVAVFWPIKGITPKGKFIKEHQISCVPLESFKSGRYMPFIYGDKKTNSNNIFSSIERFL